MKGKIENKKYVGVLKKAIKKVTYTWNRASTAQTKTIKTVLKGYGESTTSSCSASISVPALAPATITFNANGGSGSVASISTYVGVANTIPSNSLTRTGYTFNGWNTASDGSGTAYATGSTITPTGNVTLYAQWEKTTPTIRAKINGSIVTGLFYIKANNAIHLVSEAYVKVNGVWKQIE